MKPSNRANWTASVNRLTRAREARRGDILDLTLSNPTQAGIDYPLDELSEVMARAARAPYHPDPRGLLTARQSLGHAEDVVLTASTSEAYAFLFKLLCNAGDNVANGVPSYPLFEHLAGLELVELRHFPLEFHRRWELHASRVREAIDERTRAIVVVNPNNPTGSFVTAEEQNELAEIGLPIISDEVFLDYGAGSSFVRDDVLTFTLGGLSKSAGLPHYKLAWIRVSGPGRQQALSALELIADNYLSVSTAVQIALPDLLRIAPMIRGAIATRVKRNLEHLRNEVSATHAAELLPVEGGWSAVLRVPRVETDESLAVRLIEEHGVLVHPGYLFDFPEDGYLVLSLLPSADVFDEGVTRVLSAIPKG